MHIVILDGYTLNPGDLDWTALQEFGSLEVYDRTPTDEIVRRAAAAQIVFTNKTPLSADTLARLPELKYVGVLATGYDVVDVQCARGRQVIVTNVPAYGVDSVAQMVFAHILNITNNVAGHAAHVRGGGWSESEDFCYQLTPQMELAGKTLGIIGYGDIGRATAKLALAFGMDVLIHTRSVPDQLQTGEQAVDLDTVLANSHIVSLHCPLTESTFKLINERRLALMREGSVLINCSRGPLIDEDALCNALQKGKPAAAGLDVLSLEPPADCSGLQMLTNCHITPHIAWATYEARRRLYSIAVANIRAYLAGTPQNCVT